MLKNLALSLVTFIFCLVLLEGVSFFLYEQNWEGSTCYTCWHNERDQTYGFVPPKNITREAKRVCDSGKVCYDVKYTYDELGRRVVGNEHDNSSGIILLGGSIPFGEGLPDQKTFAYHIQEKSNKRVFNYSLSGSGVPYILTLLRTGRMEKELIDLDQDAYFIIGDHQKYRNHFSTHHPYVWAHPYYEVEGEKVVSRGLMNVHLKLQVKVGSILNLLKKYSYFLKVINFSYPNRSDEVLFGKLIRLVHEAKREFESRFNGKFTILLHTVDSSKGLIRALKESKTPFKYYPDERYTGDKANLCGCDSHPNAEVTEFMGKAFVEEALHNAK